MPLERVASLDVLRGAAALTVAVSHFFVHRGISSTEAEAVSATAVEIFFVLSGFVLAPQLIFCAEKHSARLFRIFLVRRWMRTIPSYLVALGAMVIVANPVIAADVVRYGIYLQNFAWQANTNDFFPVAWSLSVEEWFYVGFAGFLLVATRARIREGHRTVMILAVAMVIAITITRFAFGDLTHWGAEVRRVTLWRIDAITYGVLLYGFSSVVHLHLPAIGRYVSLFSSACFVAAAWLSYNLLWYIESTNGSLAKHLFPFAAALTGSLAIVTAVQLDGVLSAVNPPSCSSQRSSARLK